MSCLETDMPVYIINNMTIHVRAEYETYLRAFMDVFREFNGQVLVSQAAPNPLRIRGSRAR